MFYPLAHGLITLATAFGAGICVLSWRQRHTRLGRMLLAWSLCTVVWGVGTSVCMWRATPEWLKDLLDVLRMSAVVWSVLAMLGLALVHTRHTRWLRLSRFGWLGVVPLCSELLLLSPWRHLFISPLRQPLTAELVTTKFAHGPWFIVHTLYSTLIVLVSGVLFLDYLRRVSGAYRRQTILIVVGYVCQVAGMLVTAFGPKWLPRLDYASVALPISATLWYVALFRFKLFELAPIARERVVGEMEDAVVVLNAEGEIVDLNSSAAVLLGRGETWMTGELVGRALSEALPEGMERLGGLVGDGEGRAEIELETLSGRRVFDVRHTRMREGRSQVAMGEVLVLRDVTERAALIEELDAYAHTVAHDLKNPLSALRNYLEMIEEELDEGEVAQAGAIREELGRAQRVTEDMIVIVNELLKLASMRQGGEHVSREPLPMGALLERVCERLGPQLAGAQVVLPKGPLPEVVGHGPWVEEVWSNYLSNAVKYGGEPALIRVGAERIEEAGMARFWVQDNGAGLSAEQRGKLFKPFVRLETHRAIAGHGVGLSLVKRIVEQLGGSVGVESEAGAGSRFWFTLPLSEVDR